MNLKILIPFRVFAEKGAVTRIVAETPGGSLGLLPHRLDCAAALSPGILTYEVEGEGTAYVAVDEGVMVKTGADVLVSVRHAVGGADLAQLHETVKREFLKIDAGERTVRVALAKLEGGFVRRLADLQHGR